MVRMALSRLCGVEAVWGGCGPLYGFVDLPLSHSLAGLLSDGGISSSTCFMVLKNFLFV